MTLAVFEELRPSSDNLVECTVRRSCLSELQAMMLMRYLHIQHDDHWTAFSARNMMVVLSNKEKRVSEREREMGQVQKIRERERERERDRERMRESERQRDEQNQVGHTPASLAADMRMWAEGKPELQAILSHHIPHHQIGWMWTSTHIEHAACEFRKQIANSGCIRKWPEIRVENI